MITHNLEDELAKEMKNISDFDIISVFDYKGGYGEFNYMIRLAKYFRWIDEETEQLMLSVPEYKSRYEFQQYKEPSMCDYTSAAFSVSPIKSIASRRFMEILKTASAYNHEIWNCTDIWNTYLYRGLSILKKYFATYERNGCRLPIEMGYVYVIDAGNDYIKIGKTINPDQRIKQISPNMPFDCEYRHIFPTYFMSLGEKLLHHKFADFRTNGEWFHSYEDILIWLNDDGPAYTELAFFSSLHEELMRLPEMRLARLFDHRMTFDPRDTGWEVFDNFKSLYQEFVY